MIERRPPTPSTGDEVPHGALYVQDSGHMGYSYWLVLDTYKGRLAWELLPSEMEPRHTAVDTMIEKGDFQGVANKRFIGRWHHRLPVR